MSEKTLQQRLLNKRILPESPLNKELHEVKLKNERLLVEINTKYRTNDDMLAMLEKVTGQSIDRTTTVSQPFYSDFGGHITFGKHVFINKNVTFVDLGGITLEDHVLIGPGARLITVNHLTEVQHRRGLEVAPVLVKRNAWIGANVTVLPGVTIGEHSIVAADATVTKDVPAKVIVAGTPARIIRSIE